MNDLSKCLFHLVASPKLARVQIAFCLAKTEKQMTIYVECMKRNDVNNFADDRIETQTAETLKTESKKIKQQT